MNTKKIKMTKNISKFLSDLRSGSSLTLMEVQEKSKKYREKVTFDYLSRAERGLLFPSLPKLLTLSKIYKISPTVFFDLIELGEYEKLKPDIENYQECKLYGISCINRGDLDKAIGAFSRCIEIILKDKSIQNKDEHFAEIYLCSGIALARMGKPALAKEELEKAYQYRTISSSLKMRILNELANIYKNQDNIPFTELFINEALKLAEQEQDFVTIGTCYCTKANALLRIGSFKEAESCYRKAIKIFEQEKDTSNRVITLNNLASCLIKMNKLKESLEILEKSKLIAEREELKKIYALILINLGDVHRLQKNFGKARMYLLEASIIASEYEYIKHAFLAHFYLWKIAQEEKNKTAEKESFTSLKLYRAKVQETFDELKEFDSHLASLKKK